jgi:hypothetical protein
MNSKKKKPEEIEKQLLEDADMPEAWEEPIYVPPSRSARPAWYGRSKHLELAAKFFVLSLLHRLGSEATLTLAEPSDVDIAALLPSGKALTIDVKTLTGTRDWWIDRFRVRKHHFVAFVCFQQPLSEPDPSLVPELYIWSSQRLQSFLRREKKQSISLESLAARHSATEALEAFAAHTGGY